MRRPHRTLGALVALLFLVSMPTHTPVEPGRVRITAQLYNLDGKKTIRIYRDGVLQQEIGGELGETIDLCDPNNDTIRDICTYDENGLPVSVHWGEKTYDLYLSGKPTTETRTYHTTDEIARSIRGWDPEQRAQVIDRLDTSWAAYVARFAPEQNP